MKRRTLRQVVITAIASCVLADTHAVAPGFYMGLALGPASNNANDLNAQTTTPLHPLVAAHPRSNQFGSRLYLGNKFTDYAGLELGFDFFTGIKYDTGGVDTCSSPQLRVRAIDVMFKGDFGYSRFDVFGKAGAALVYDTTSGSLAPALRMQCGVSNYVTKVRPVFSIGASYGFNQNWIGDISYTQVMVGQPINSVSFVGFGISYHFVDKYCGQFLCDD